MQDEALDAGPVEEIGAVLDDAAEPVGGLDEVEAEVELGDGAVQRQLLGSAGDRTGAGGGERRGAELEDDLEQGVAGGVPLGLQPLDEHLERDVLVVVGPERHRSHPAEQLAEGGPAAGVDPQHQRVHEEADQALDLRPRPVRHRATHDDVVLAAVPVQHGDEAGEQRHEQRRALPLGQASQRRDHDGRDVERHVVAVVAELRGPGPVGGELQDGEIGELLAPVVDLAVQLGPGERLALPVGEVAVLERQRRQRAGPAGGERGVDDGELGREDRRRPAVAHDVVDGEQQRPVGRTDPDELGPQQRTGLQVEGGAGERGGPPLDLGPAGRFGQPAHVDDVEGDVQRRSDRAGRDDRRSRGTSCGAPRGGPRSRRGCARAWRGRSAPGVGPRSSRCRRGCRARAGGGTTAVAGRRRAPRSPSTAGRRWRRTGDGARGAWRRTGDGARGAWRRTGDGARGHGAVVECVSHRR